MSWEYNAYNDQSQDGENIEMFEFHMQKIRDQAIEKLSQLELAAIFENISDFIKSFKEEVRYKSIE